MNDMKIDEIGRGWAHSMGVVIVLGVVIILLLKYSKTFNKICDKMSGPSNFEL